MTCNFDKDVEETIKLYEDAIGQFASRTWQMIENLGKIEAISKLVVSPNLQKGFKVLHEKGKLDKSFEAIVLKYKNKFRADIIEAAEWRLLNPNKLLKK